jgi:hypothetical protein
LAGSRTFRLRNTNFISRAIFLTDPMCRPRADDISDASAPRFASLANRCFSSSVHSFGRTVRFMVGGLYQPPFPARPVAGHYSAIPMPQHGKNGRL